MRAPRNPRRAYDQDGSEIPPATIASTRALGMTTVTAFCEARGCEHHAIVPLERWPEALPIPDLALRLQCSKCGSRKIRMILNLHDPYAKAHSNNSATR